MQSSVASFEPVGRDGLPGWIDGLAEEYPNHLLHVVRDVTLDEAISAVGGRRIVDLGPHQLPESRLGYPTPIHAAVGDDCTDLLLAGSHGRWSFVYDVSGLTSGSPDGDVVRMLSFGGKVAATSVSTINATFGLSYARDGIVIFDIGERYDPGLHEARAPAEIRVAAAAADRIDDGAGSTDLEINMRIVCALAGLTWNFADLRSQALTVGEVVSSTTLDCLADISRWRSGNAS